MTISLESEERVGSGQWEESRDGKAQFKIGRGHHQPTRKLLHLNKILENKFCHLQLLITTDLL